MIDDFKTAKALLDKLQAFADTQGHRLAIQGAPFEPITTEIYIKESFLANDIDPLGLSAGSSDRQDPIYQIDVFTPKGQGGKFSGLGIVNLLKTEFPRASYVVDDSEQRAQVESVTSAIMPANDTHNRSIVEVNLTVLATST